MSGLGVCMMPFICFWLHFLLQYSPKMKHTQVTYSHILPHHVKYSIPLNICLTYGVITCLSKSRLLPTYNLYQLLFLLPELNSYHVCLHPSEFPFHMCTLGMYIYMCVVVWNSAHAFVFLCENMNNGQYLCPGCLDSTLCSICHHKLKHSVCVRES